MYEISEFVFPKGGKEMKAIKKNMNKWLGLVLAVAMVFSLNLTSMTAKAATTYTLPTETTEQALPSGVTGMKIIVFLYAQQQMMI